MERNGMKRSASQKITVFFLMHFLLWMQLGAAQWNCQCDHTSIEQTCHIPQKKKAGSSCCAKPQSAQNKNSAAPCHNQAAQAGEKNASSCCSGTNESEVPAAAYSTPAYFCQTACLTLVSAQSKEVVVRELLKKGRELPSSAEPVLSDYIVEKASSNFALYEFSLLPRSSPLFLLHSSFLI